MSSLNKAMIIGYLGRDPETKYMPNGDAVTNISVATSYKPKDGEEQTEWHRVTFFGRVAEVAGEYLKKGSLCYVEGRIRTRKWQDKEGHDRYTTEIIADRLQLLGGKRDDRDERDAGRDERRREPEPKRDNKTTEPSKKPAGKFDDMEDDIPF